MLTGFNWLMRGSQAFEFAFLCLLKEAVKKEVRCSAVRNYYCKVGIEKEN
jgi:hypothetical protein